MIVHPGPVVAFLIANQNVRDPFSLDWNKVTKFSDCLFTDKGLIPFCFVGFLTYHALSFIFPKQLLFFTKTFMVLI